MRGFARSAAIGLGAFLVVAQAAPAMANRWGPVDSYYSNQRRVSGYGSLYNEASVWATNKYVITDTYNDGNSVYGKSYFYHYYATCDSNGCSEKWNWTRTSATTEFQGGTQTHYLKDQLRSTASRVRAESFVCAQLGWPIPDSCSPHAFPSFDLMDGEQPAPVLVRCREVEVRYGARTVLDRLGLDLRPGITALAGPNGAGKSTLLRVLATLTPPRRGEVHVDGRSLRTPAGRRHARRRIGYLPQEPDHLRQLTVVESVAYAAWLQQVPRRRRDEAVRRTVDELDLADVADAPLKELSGGTRRRAYLAQVLVHRPDVLLLDEPTTGLDAEHRIELRRLLRRLAAGRAVLLSTHLTEDLELLADRVIALAGGQIVFDGPPAELVARADDDEAGTGERPIERGLQALTRARR